MKMDFGENKMSCSLFSFGDCMWTINNKTKNKWEKNSLRNLCLNLECIPKFQRVEDWKKQHTHTQNSSDKCRPIQPAGANRAAHKGQIVRVHTYTHTNKQQWLKTKQLNQMYDSLSPSLPLFICISLFPTLSHDSSDIEKDRSERK